MYIDAHCHPDRIELSAFQGDFSLLVETVRAAGVERILAVAVDPPSWQQLSDLTAPYADMFPLSAGEHPLYVAEHFDLALLEHQAQDPRVIAIGETGLDYHYCEDEAQQARQRERFVAQIELANRIHKPLIIHCRHAAEDVLALLRAHDHQHCGMFHCFSESYEVARAVLDHGFYISFSGILTFNNADELRRTAATLPLERLLIETDAPWLAPKPQRGKTNHSGYIVHTATCLAEVLNLPVAELAALTAANFQRLFQ